jgi:hypothetical protein
MGKTPAVESPDERPVTRVERAVGTAFALSQGAGPVLVSLGLIATVFEWRPGAYLLLFWLLASFLFRDLLTALAFRRDGLAELSRIVQVALTAGFVALVLAYVAMAAALGWRQAAHLAIVSLLAHIAAHVVAGIASYRDVFSRPWPAVQPVVDDDDW